MGDELLTALTRISAKHNKNYITALAKEFVYSTGQPGKQPKKEPADSIVGDKRTSL